jgi:uncharacterized protein
MRAFAVHVFAVALALVATLAAATVAVPPLSAHVTDVTATLTDAQRNDLEAKLVALEQRKGAQVAVLLLPTIGEETIEQFAVRAFEEWKLGRGGVDDGVLLVVAKDDRKLRIEVGYGLEGAIPDAIAHRVIEEYLVPNFRSGDIGGGISAATDALIKLVDGEALPPVAWEEPTGSRMGLESLFVMLFWVMIGCNIVLVWLPKVVRAGVAGVVCAAVAGFSGVGFPWLGLAGIGAFIASLVMFSKGLGRIGSGGTGGWSSGSGGWSGGSSGGSSSGSSWSGGGGRSGGGGASGSW